MVTASYKIITNKTSLVLNLVAIDLAVISASKKS
jgi:hypothetical protein